MKKERISNFELLRIIAIVMITLHHISLNTNILMTSGINNILAQFFVIGGKIGVNIFILITGYFQIEKEIKYSKILNIWYKVFFYSIFLALISTFIFKVDCGILEFITYIFPVIFKKWWFVTAYIFLFIFSPYINLLIKKLDNKKFKNLITILTIGMVLVPTITNVDIIYNEFLWFIYIYMIGAYIKLNIGNFKKRNYLMYSVLSYIFIFISIILFGYFGKQYSIFTSAQYYLINQTSPLVLTSSVFLFMHACTQKKYYYKTINKISNYVFSMYLIQSHPMFNKLIYTTLNNMLENNFFWLNAMIYIIILLLIAYIVDYIVEKIIKINSKLCN